MITTKAKVGDIISPRMDVRFSNNWEIQHIRMAQIEEIHSSNKYGVPITITILEGNAVNAFSTRDIGKKLKVYTKDFDFCQRSSYEVF